MGSTQQPSTCQVSRLEPQGSFWTPFLSPLSHSASPQAHDPDFCVQYLSFYAPSCLREYNGPRFHVAAPQFISHTAAILLKCNGDHAILSAALLEAFLALNTKASLASPAAPSPPPAPHCVSDAHFPRQFFCSSECFLLTTASIASWCSSLCPEHLPSAPPALGFAPSVWCGLQSHFLREAPPDLPCHRPSHLSTHAFLQQRTPCPG